MEGEPDSGVGENHDLGRLFSLLIQGQQNTNRIMADMQRSVQQSLHMAQSFGTGATPGAAYQARQAQGGSTGPSPGQTTQQTLRAQQGANGVFTVTGNGTVNPPGSPAPGSPQGPSGAPGPVPGSQPPAGGSTRPAGPSPAPQRPNWTMPPLGQTTADLLNNRLTDGSTDFRATFSQLGQQTYDRTLKNMNRAAFGVWSPYASGGGGGGGQGGSGGGSGGGGGGGGGGHGGGGVTGPGPYGMGPAGMPPNPIYFGGAGTPYGAYGAYGPYGPSGGGPGGGGGGGGGSLSTGANKSQSGGGGHLWGMGSGIGGWARRNIPLVGMIDKGFGEAKSQRNKNEYYQNINGGSNFAGFAERGHEEAYVASTSAMFNDEEARAAFKGVTRIGYNGVVGDRFSRQGGRQDALNYVYHGKTAYGASINESLQQLEMVSKNSTLSIKGLQQALKDVSDEAGKTGVNAQMARKQLTNLVQEGVQSGYGAGAIPTAANLQMGKTSLGRSYQDIDLTGQMGQQYTYMASSQMGMTYNQYTAMQTTNPLAASQARAGQNLSLLSQIFTQDEVAWVKDKANGMGGTLDSDAALSIVPEFLQAFPNHNIAVIQSQLAAFGIVQTDDPQKALAYAFTLMAGQNGDLANAQKTAKANKPASGKAAAKADDSADKGFIKNFDTKIRDPGAAKILGGSFVEAVTAGMVDDIGIPDAEAMKEYKKGVAKNKGDRNPVIENILKTLDKEDDAKVIVHTSKGQRVVSLQEAIKSHSKELSSGSARFVEGEAKGKSVSDLLGSGAVDTTAKWGEEARKSKGKEGESLKKWQKDHSDKTAKGTGAGANGRVVVDLTDTAKQLLKVSSATGIAGANGEGAPPLNFYNWNASR